MKVAFVNDYEEAKLFFDEFDISYEEITEGENKGKLLVKLMDPEDQCQIQEAEKRLRRSRLQVVIDHPNVFLDQNDNVIVTFSPYDISELPPNRPWLEMSEHSIYGNGTKTFVVRISRSELNARKLQELEQRIEEAEQKVLQAKKELDKETEKMARLLEERDRLSKGIDGGRITLNRWDCTWEGHAIWDAGSVTMDCSYQAKMAFRKTEEGIRGPEIQWLEMEHPGFKRPDIVKALKKSLCEKLDDEFEDYCTEDDYYPPVTEDFEAEAYAKGWAEERGLELIRFEGDGSDGGYRPKSRRRT